ncbi:MULTISPECIES: Tex family protein [unclassified Imperialibacter]|uniref:Tex family protein n=1 Tax=unclassified Imperialibacter TaxID=2629706 RepID=UPI0012542794|nr:MULTISPECIES: Tex family protein [unclassified Imperialibacter]CAD5250986.1 transcriptional accessory protein [Imperialibacter sp. 89]CAD5283781.1 transcriptional accessory protein [Imperialibacter sp. 75]VVT10636.1 transcriptional accessory protein [Imperialibacter sp. EC-SDR9]
MSQAHYLKIAAELSISPKQVVATAELLDEGGTVPFISRYRKERTGSLDEVFIAKIRDRIGQLRDLDKRREAILKSIEEQGKLTDELKAQIDAAETMSSLEDIYLPYKPKRRTRATIAREKGLEPLALWIFERQAGELAGEAEKYLDEEKGVASAEEALQGARDIIAEIVNEDPDARKKMRELFNRSGVVYSKVMKGKEEEGQKYKDYFEWSEPLDKVPSHRLLAMRRGEKEMILMLDMYPPEEEATLLLERQFVKGSNPVAEQVKEAVHDSYKRLLKPSMETEARLGSKDKADVEAINVFAENLKQLLMAAPLGQKSILAVDPGFRTGCKVAALDSQGKLLDFEAIYPNEPQKAVQKAAATVAYMVEKYKIQAVAIGNGTASRETEQFIKSIGLPSHVLVAMVNESGASIYSASDVAREEFPDQDVTVRGAVSIGRRLMDPLAELVKIDAKSIGVGQYQHDVDQTELKKSLDDVVMSCVNAVGVELNTASKQLLTYVSGLGPQLAQNIVEFRNANGPFKDRESLKKVPRLGDKAYEQAAGFLRIRDGKNVLDTSAVHPERYNLVEQMAKDLGCGVTDLMTSTELRRKLDLKKYVSEEVGLPTLTDIIEELAKPGRDPRESFEVFSFTDGVNEMADLKMGMKLPGIVTNVTKFGAFVDIGVHQDGLVHISHLADKFISDPSEAVKLQQKVMVTVVEVDLARKRIALSMKADPFATGPAPRKASDKKDERPEPRRQERRSFQPQKPQQSDEPDGDLQAQLAKLRGKFGG